MNKISQTIMESLEEFDIVDYPLAWKITKLSKIDQHHEKCSWRQASMLCDCAMVQSIREVRKHDKEKLLQSQIKLIESFVYEMQSKKQNGHGCGCYSWDRALNDQISSLNETLEFLKKSL